MTVGNVDFVSDFLKAGFGRVHELESLCVLPIKEEEVRPVVLALNGKRCKSMCLTKRAGSDKSLESIVESIEEHQNDERLMSTPAAASRSSEVSRNSAALS